MTSQLVGDVVIDTTQSCDQQPRPFTQDPARAVWFVHEFHIGVICMYVDTTNFKVMFDRSDTIEEIGDFR